MTEIPEMVSQSLAGTGTDAEFRVLHALRVRGFAGEAGVAASADLDLPTAEAVLADGAEHGQTRKREGRISGWSLTPAGRARHVILLGMRMNGPEVLTVTAAYKAFLDPNQALKQLITDWQLGADEASTGKTGAAARLAAVDDEIRPVLAQLAAAATWFAGYRDRLTRASEAFAGGDADALAKPMTGSYHDVWMELHEDLLVTLGREREPEDG